MNKPENKIRRVIGYLLLNSFSIMIMLFGYIEDRIRLNNKWIWQLFFISGGFVFVYSLFAINDIFFGDKNVRTKK